MLSAQSNHLPIFVGQLLSESKVVCFVVNNILEQKKVQLHCYVLQCTDVVVLILIDNNE